MSFSKAGPGPLNLALTRGWKEAVQAALACARLILCALVAVFAAQSAAAQDLTLPGDVQQAIGRLNTAGYRTRNMCSAVLIAPDRILTAAHCVPTAASARAAMRFVAGWDRGDYVAVREIAQVDVHPEFQGPTVENIPYDIAVLQLDAPIADVSPLALAAFEGSEVVMSGYHTGRPHLATTLGPCPANAMRQQTLIMITCPTQRGFSGAPVLVRTTDGWAVVAVTSAANATSTFAVRVANWAVGAVLDE